MPRKNPLSDVEGNARRIAEDRVAAVRALVEHREQIARLQAELAAAELHDVALWDRALAAGWTGPDLVRQVGLERPAKRVRIEQRRAAALRAAQRDGADPSEAHGPA